MYGMHPPLATISRLNENQLIRFGLFYYQIFTDRAPSTVIMCQIQSIAQLNVSEFDARTVVCVCAVKTIIFTLY